MRNKSLKLFTSRESGITFVGKSQWDEYYEARENGRAYGYMPVHADANSTGHDAIECVIITDLPKELLPLTAKDRKFLDGAFEADFTSCGECGFMHDTDDYSPGFTVRECEAYCLECVPDELKLNEVKEPKDIFKAPRVDENSLPKYFKAVETLFCDSSGFGSPAELALTKRQTEARVESLLEEHGTLYAGLTGVGQFQVYVTLYRKAESKKVKAKAKRKLTVAR